MKVEDFCTHVRTNAGTVRLDQVRVETGTQTFQAHGTVQTKSEGFHLRLTINNGSVQLPSSGRLYTEEQFWTIQGLIDDEIPFSVRGLPDGTEQHLGRGAPCHRAYFNVGRLCLTEGCTEEERHLESQRWNEVLALNRSKRGENTDAPTPSENDVFPLSFFCYARLIGHKLIGHNTSVRTLTTVPLEGEEELNLAALQGEFTKCEYALNQEGDDCIVRIRSITGTTICRAEFEKAVDAFYCALSFVSAQDVFPQEHKINEDHYTILHWVTPPVKSLKGRYPLLNRKACFKGADITAALACAANFFFQESPLVENVRIFAHLARNAAVDSVPPEVGTLALCSIFEGLVDALHQAFCSQGNPSDDECIFNEAKADLSAICGERISQHAADNSARSRAFQRLQGLITSARFERTSEKLHRLANHFSLPWEGCFQSVLGSWNQARNPLAHGNLNQQRGFREIQAQSEIAGGINLLIATSMGYHGLAVFSFDQYRSI